MPLKTSSRCKVCLLITEYNDVRLLQRIYGSARFVAGGETLADIYRDYEDHFGYSALTIHAKRHQALTEGDLKKQTLTRLNNQAANKAVLSAIHHGEVRKLVMERGYKGIKSGRIKLKAADVLKAAKDEADIELKQKDQSIEMMKMITMFQSGELKTADDGRIIEGEVLD